MTSFDIRKAELEDLPEINGVIAQAVMQWDLPERVKRLSIQSFSYDPVDFSHFEMMVAAGSTAPEDPPLILGLCAWDMTEAPDVALIHGLFVKPEFQRQSIGTTLLHALEEKLKTQGVKTLSVKAQKDAVNFFLRQGFVASGDSGAGDYEYYLIKKLSLND